MRKVPKVVPPKGPATPRKSVVDPETGEINVPWGTMDEQLKELGLI